MRRKGQTDKKRKLEGLVKAEQEGNRMPREDRKAIWIAIAINTTALLVIIIGGLLAWNSALAKLEASTVPRKEIEEKIGELVEDVASKVPRDAFDRYVESDQKLGREISGHLSRLSECTRALENSLTRIEMRLNTRAGP